MALVIQSRLFPHGSSWLNVEVRDRLGRRNTAVHIKPTNFLLPFPDQLFLYCVGWC